MNVVSRKDIADYLYCISRHCRELITDARNEALPKERRDAAGAKYRALYALKNKVLLKLVSEKLAAIKKKPQRIGNVDYYLITLDRETAFHITKDSYTREMIKGREQKA